MRELPPTWDQFGPEAKRQFLEASRAQHEVINLILNELGIDERYSGEDRITNDTLVEMYVRLNELEIQDAMSDEA